MIVSCLHAYASEFRLIIVAPYLTSVKIPGSPLSFTPDQHHLKDFRFCHVNAAVAHLHKQYKECMLRFSAIVHSQINECVAQVITDLLESPIDSQVDLLG